jgi:hypothetical protein
MVFFALRTWTGIFSSSSSSNGTATAFSTDFHNTTNSLNWQTGQLDNGVTAGFAQNQYLIQTTLDNTVFPYPQALGTLPAQFTLTTTIKEQEGSSNLIYGLAFRFGEQNGTVNCYMLVVNNAGYYQIIELGNGHTIAQPLWQGNYAGGSGAHTLQVKEEANNVYTFSIDGKSIAAGIDNSTTLTLNDLSGGSMALVATGPGGEFAASLVQLSIP